MTAEQGPDRIRAELVRTGGFGGMTVHARLDSAELDRAAAAELAALVDAAGLDRLAEAGAGREPVPDEFRYRLAVWRGRRRWEVELGDRDVPPRLRPLLGRLIQAARPNG